jgi:hypothetical protein
MARFIINKAHAPLYFIYFLCELITMGCMGSLSIILIIKTRLSGLVARVLEYRSRGPGSIPGATIFPEK